MTIKNIIDTKFKDVKYFKIKSFSDQRGSFQEVFNKEIQSLIGEDVRFVQDNESLSKYGVLRGLHFQKPPFEQSKLVRVSSGLVQDVIVDIRPKSKTYGEWESYELSQDNNMMLFVPKGFAHGFLTLSNLAVVNYKVDNFYSNESDSGILYNDSHIGINWKLPLSDIVVSKKDNDLPAF